MSRNINKINIEIEVLSSSTLKFETKYFQLDKYNKTIKLLEWLSIEDEIFKDILKSYIKKNEIK